MVNSALELHKKMLPNSISLSFKGNVSVELVDSLLMIISDRLESIESNLNIRKKVYGVMLECLQNLTSHIEKNEVETNEEIVINYDSGSVLFMIDTNVDCYEVITANYVANEKVEQLVKSLEEINSLDNDQLKQLYNKTLKNKTFSDKGGAGLGFIDIARRSNQKLNYSFTPIDKENTFFSLQISINKNIN